MAFETNVIGNGAVTDNFIPLLRQSTSGKIIFLTSGLGSFTQATDPSNGFYNLDAFSYRASKAALNMLMVEWARVLGKDGIKVWGVCPGFCATNLSGDAEAAKEMGGKDPSLGALVVLDVVEGRRERDVGRVVFDTGVRPW
ncbi:hypothetical protein CFAM422_012440 [Trichoderma lentiforme]|uniref:Uncharacterized protein n=1 Tax=Trichoderma lentiforme TaxID=1567552 RepID=A0A9P4X2N8_9HYPO|nr:hypothetical protein CFAM422_012440 [Trichoderma lentiforme]